MTDGWFNVRQASAYLGLSMKRVTALAEQGMIPSERDQRERLKFRVSKLDAWSDAQKIQSGTRDG